MANRPQGSGVVLALARQIVGLWFPETSNANLDRLAWLMVGTDAGRAELRLVVETKVGSRIVTGNTDRDALFDLSQIVEMVRQPAPKQNEKAIEKLSNLMRKLKKTEDQMIANLK